MINKIICIGIINLDVIVKPVTQWPALGELLHADQTLYIPGGTALNTAVSISKLGLFPVDLIGSIGNDYAGEKIKLFLHENSVNSSGISVENSKPTGSCIVAINPSGDRSFIYTPGANDIIQPVGELTDRVPKECYVHLGGVLDMALLSGSNLLQIVKELKSKACFVSMDLAWDWGCKGWVGLKNSLAFTDLLSMNAQESKALTGESNPILSAKRIVDSGCHQVVIKLGSEGAYVHAPDYTGFVPGFRVNVIDTTGAGDAFSGALLTGIIKGLDPYKAARFANVVGAFCVQLLGATEGIPSYEEAIDFIQSHNN
jgi:sugar/nucleoside kinase (ribokinase family)